ncbi:MAG: hypothetical protein V4456_05920 [Bacteroidota bacterium]
MEKISFDIYIPDKKRFRFTPNTIVLIIWLSLITIFGIWGEYIPSETRTYASIIGCCITIFYIIRSLIAYAPLRGQFKGKIEFTNDAIIINNKPYYIKGIKKIDFYFGDYYGEIRSGYRSVNPKLSQGVNNSIEFATIDDVLYNIQFKIRTPKGYFVLSPFINNALKAQKISRFRAIDLIGEENIY